MEDFKEMFKKTQEKLDELYSELLETTLDKTIAKNATTLILDCILQSDKEDKSELLELKNKIFKEDSDSEYLFQYYLTQIVNELLENENYAIYFLTVLTTNIKNKTLTIDYEF